MKLFLAPLADFTDSPFRQMCLDGGADKVFTEMVSAAALSHGHSPTRHLLEVSSDERNVSCQIFGAEETDIAYAAKEIETIKDRFEAIDLNAGCPMQRITRAGAGAALVTQPEKVYRLLKSMKENTSLPVTLKTRIGKNPGTTTIFEILDAAEKAGASRITVHARYASQMHGGPLNLDILSEVVSRAKIPVTGNGSVVDSESARMMLKTGVDSLMIGRAAMSNPYIFAEIKATSQGQSIPAKPSPYQLFQLHLQRILKFRRDLITKFPNDRISSEDGFASIKMHVHLFRYFNGLPGAAQFRGKLTSIRTIADMQKAVQDFK
jgi:nifR3 family TIM-barrel protein